MIVIFVVVVVEKSGYSAIVHSELDSSHDASLFPTGTLVQFGSENCLATCS